MNTNFSQKEAEELVEKLKAFVKEGNITRVVLKRKGEQLLDIPLNVGLAGTILGLAAAPWAMVAGALVSYGMDCTLELHKTDGTVEELNAQNLGAKLDGLGAAAKDKLKNFTNQ